MDDLSFCLFDTLGSGALEPDGEEELAGGKQTGEHFSLKLLCYYYNDQLESAWKIK